MAFDNTQARREGWQLSERDDGLHAIQRLDDPRSIADWFPEESAFADDSAAARFVYGEAGSGSAYHQTAAFLNGKAWKTEPFVPSPRPVPVHTFGDDSELEIPGFLRR